jgi:hypothetical protein
MPEEAITKVDTSHGLSRRRQYSFWDKAKDFQSLINRKRAAKQAVHQQMI